MNNVKNENKIPSFLRKTALQLKDGVIDNNPLLVQILGTCPTLAVTTSVKNAVGMGIATTTVLVFSNLSVSLLRRFIPRQVRLISYIVIFSGFVSALQMIIKAYFPSLDRALGVFIPLIVVNCIILGRAEEYASKNGIFVSILDALGMGLGFGFVLTLLAVFREFLGANKLMGMTVIPGMQPASAMLLAPGAFILIAFMLWGMNAINSRSK